MNRNHSDRLSATEQPCTGRFGDIPLSAGVKLINHYLTLPKIS